MVYDRLTPSHQLVASDHQFVGDAAYINLEIEALHRRAREMPGQTSRDGSAADELVGQEQMDVEDRINLNPAVG